MNITKKNSPILCRDKTTLKLLKNKGVDVNFYGCLTQLLDIKNIPDNNSYKEKYKDSIIYIDCPNKWKKRDKNENKRFVLKFL